MNLKDVLREVSQTQSGQALCDSTYVRFQRGQVLRDRGSGGSQEEGSWCLMGSEFQFGRMRKF